jgi:hypothetical protein
VASKPENTFIASVHRRLPRALHREKMANPYRGGTADVWYSGDRADQWVEYKYVPKLPVRAALVAGLSELQKDWLRKRHGEGRNVAVVVGSKNGAIILTAPDEWEAALSPVECQRRLVSREELATWITTRTLHGSST